MRNAAGIFGLLCSVVVVGLVGRYGYKTTDEPTDALIVAFLYGVIATFALAGHAFAVFLWRYSRVAGLAAGAIAAVSLGLNLSNSLGAIAGRQDTAQQERIDKNRKIRATEAELKRLTGLRDAMEAFVHTDEEAVTAAKRAADAATASRQAECQRRGDRCRDRERDEREANERLTKSTTAKAATERAAKLEADAEAQRKKLVQLGAIVKVSVQGSALAGLFRLPDEEAGFLVTVQQFSTAAVVELIILICLIGWEVSRPTERPACAGREPQTDTSAAVCEPVATTPLIDGDAVEAAKPAVIPKPDRPKLVVVNNDVPKILAKLLEPNASTRAKFVDLYRTYATQSRAQGRTPVKPEEFAESAKAFCKRRGIKTRTIDGMPYLLDVQIVASTQQAAENIG